MTASTAPVAVFMYKRPAHARKLLASLAASPLARESDLFLFCDAARSPADEAPVQEVRKVAKAATGFRSVTLVERTENWGLSRSVTGAVSDLCTRFGKVIAVEDDLILAPSFLGFMNDSLARYENEPQVMQVTGFQFPLRATPADSSVFLPIISCWGWGTWARAWSAYDPSARSASELLADQARSHAFDLEGAYDYVRLLREQCEGRIDSWGVRWYLSVFERGGLVLYPPRSLVSNEGFDGSGTHLESRVDDFAKVRGEWPDPAGFGDPARLAVSSGALAEVRGILRAARFPGLITRIRRKLAL